MSLNRVIKRGKGGRVLIEDEWKIVEEYPYDTKRKRETQVVRKEVNTSTGEERLIYKEPVFRSRDPKSHRWSALVDFVFLNYLMWIPLMVAYILYYIAPFVCFLAPFIARRDGAPFSDVMITNTNIVGFILLIPLILGELSMRRKEIILSFMSLFILIFIVLFMSIFAIYPLIIILTQ